MMSDALAVGRWSRVRRWITGDQPLYVRVIDANDGIVATAGLLEGFAGAGAADSVLVLAASAATVAGSLSLGGAKWAEEAAERETHFSLAEEEAAQLTANPEDELAELAGYWQHRGLSPEIATEVARQLTARDALAAQLEYEHGIDELPSAFAPVREGIRAAVSFVVGALIPLLITVFVPGALEAPAILAAVIISLTITSFLASRTGNLLFWRVLLRSLAVGVGTTLVGYAVGALLF
jgi:vacuolar iron transporter family protein